LVDGYILGIKMLRSEQKYQKKSRLHWLGFLPGDAEAAE
jgi:hypothetical protein